LDYLAPHPPNQPCFFGSIFSNLAILVGKNEKNNQNSRKKFKTFEITNFKEKGYS
jgi:hypothetical protein